MKSSLKVTLFVAAVGTAALSYGQQSPSLGVGSTPPPLKVAKWAKGAPVKSFEKGKVYVIEFWATWCGPCKVSIPHLTDMAHKFKGQVTFTGVSVWENRDPKDSSYFPKVDQFVKDMGVKMDYNVAVDDPAGTMATTWMTAAGQNGIPAAFVIDQTGKIAWIGHPMDGLDEVLDQVIVKKFDAQGAAKIKAQKEEQMNKLNSRMQEVMKLAKDGKGKDAVAKLDSVVADYPEMRTNLLNYKFTLMLGVDEAAAYSLAKSLGENELKDEAMALNQIAWTIAEANPPIKNPDYDVALELALRALELTKSSDAYILDTTAYVYAKKGDYKKALDLQTKAVAIISKPGTAIDEQTKKEIADRLSDYKKKAGGN